MSTCPSCYHSATMRHGHDRGGRQRFLCKGCRRTYTADSATAFSGYHWPADVILMAVRWYLWHALWAPCEWYAWAATKDVPARCLADYAQTSGNAR